MTKNIEGSSIYTDLLNKSTKVLKPFITQEMFDHFNTRTNTHMDNVITFYNKLNKNGFFFFNDISNNDSNLEKHKPNMIDIVLHDMSKFKEPELAPYILLTWKYKVGEEEFNKLNIPEEYLRLLTLAIDYHVKTNKHHPEFYDKSIENNIVINSNDRDKIKNNMNPVDATTMPYQYIIEMVLDWNAVSIERNSSLIEWANNNINKRWLFTDNQIKLIYDTIDALSKLI